jgi:cold shock CspA family protein
VKNYGRVKYFNPERKFGFIATLDEKEFFFHLAHFVGQPALKPVLSQQVEFEVAPPIREGRAPMAVNVTPVGGLETLGGAQ